MSRERRHAKHPEPGTCMRNYKKHSCQRTVHLRCGLILIHNQAER